MNEKALIEKLLKIEAVFAGAASEGERISAERAKQRILLRLKELLANDAINEYKFTFPDMWARKVFITLLRRYDLKPYRYPGQKHTTVMLKVPKTFIDETLWPEFQKIHSELHTYLQEVTDRITRKVLHTDTSDAAVVDVTLNPDMVNSNIINTNQKSASSSGQGAHRNKKKKRNKKKRRH